MFSSAPSGGQLNQELSTTTNLPRGPSDSFGDSNSTYWCGVLGRVMTRFYPEAVLVGDILWPNNPWSPADNEAAGEVSRRMSEIATMAQARTLHWAASP